MPIDEGLPRRAIAATVAATLLLGGCAQPGRNLYGAGDVGVMIETTEATVVASRAVSVEGTPTAAGPVAGGLSAGGLASALISGGGLATLAILLSGLLGAGAGYAAERELRSGEGTEYLLETTDGRMVTIVQTGDDGPAFANGTPVLMQTSGRYSRLIEHPDVDADGPGDAWVDPDATEAPPTLPRTAPPGQMAPEQ